MVKDLSIPSKVIAFSRLSFKKFLQNVRKEKEEFIEVLPKAGKGNKKQGLWSFE